MGKVKNILEGKSSEIISARPDQTVFEALEIMLNKNVSALLIMDNRELKGIFTERDYARKVILRGKASRDTKLQEVMTEAPLTIDPAQSVDECMRLMTSKFIRHLPVIENGELVGIISIGDLVKHIIEEQKYTIENLEHYITGR